jgi:hypothetical protein
MAGSIVFNTINVNGLETNAAIFVGENSASGWDSHNKNQNSIGFIFSGFAAYTLFPGNFNFVSDNDLIDTVINDGFEAKASPTSQV